MSATTVFGQIRNDQASTHSKRNAVIALTVIALFAVSFFVGRATATSHPAATSSAQVGTRAQLSPADRAVIAGDVAPLSNAGSTVQLSAANRAFIAGEVAPRLHGATNVELSAANRAIVGEVAPITPTYVEVAPNGEQLSPANRAQIANDGTPVTQQFSQANAVSCRVGLRC